MYRSDDNIEIYISSFGVGCKESKQRVRPETEQLKFAAIYNKYDF